MSDHTPSSWWAVLLAELTAAGVGGHAIESLSHLPGWVGGLIGGSPRDGAMTARETYARGVGSYEGQ